MMLSSVPLVSEDNVVLDTSTVYLTLADALKIALSENISVKVADHEIQRAKYAKRGSYAALFPQIDGSAAYQRTIKKQVMYMDFDMGSLGGFGGLGDGSGSSGSESGAGSEGGSAAGSGSGAGSATGSSAGSGSSSSSKSGGGLEVGRWNTWSAGITASMPLVNAQLWKSLSISADEVELAVEKARGSRLAMVTSVKEAYFAVLLAKEANAVYEQSYQNAMDNLKVTQDKYNVQKASEMELLRAKTTVANVVPDVYKSRGNVEIALWQLKAVIGIDLDRNIDVSSTLSDYAQQMFYDLHQNDSIDLSRNSSLRQLDIQVEELAKTVQLNKLAYVPSLGLAFNYTYSAMTNDFNFKEYKWTPYSYIGFSLQVPIFSGGKRFHAVKQSKVQLEQVKLQQQQAERELRIAVKNYLNTMETNMNSYYAAVSAVESAQKGYDISAKSYQVGRSTLIEVNDAMLAKAQAELMKCQSIYAFLVAKAGLEQQLGKDYDEE